MGGICAVVLSGWCILTHPICGQPPLLSPAAPHPQSEPLLRDRWHEAPLLPVRRGSSKHLRPGGQPLATPGHI